MGIDAKHNKKLGMSLFQKIESLKIIRSISGGLVMLIPVVMIGSFSLLFRTLPIGPYQQFLHWLFGGAVVEILTFFYNATFGMLSVFLTLTISITYSRLTSDEITFTYGGPICALICFFILTGVLSDSFDIRALGATGLFTALVCGVGACALYHSVVKMGKGRRHIYSESADLSYNNAVAVILPSVIVITVFAVLNYGIVHIFSVSGFNELFTRTLDSMFMHLGANFWSGFLYVFLSSLMWFFGIHGSNILETVSMELFAPATQANAAAVAAGALPTEIVTKTFFDSFVLIGGCGSAICLLAAVLLFSKRKSNRKLSRIAAVPILFNINEILIFGLPVIFNPILFLPFILTPIVSYLVAYFATVSGLVPLTVNQVEWTTPVLLSGYLSTGSVSGSILQIVNLAIGVGIYAPFIKLFDKARRRDASRNMDQLVKVLQESERENKAVVLTELTGECGSIAKGLVFDLKRAIYEDELTLYYQPQYDNCHRCIGAEALLRWKHEVYGMLYPPLVIKVASEAGLLYELEKTILRKALEGCRQINAGQDRKIKISVNVSAETVQNPMLVEFLKTLVTKRFLEENPIYLEVTEQMAVRSTKDTQERFEKIHRIGFKLAIDDFSMGHTSLKYLQENTFDMVKLDGALVRGMKENPRSREIISSILYLSHSLNFTVVAEYVEDEAQRAALEEIGCQYYQGYLYSPALPLEDLVKCCLTGIAGSGL